MLPPNLVFTVHHEGGYQSRWLSIGSGSAVSLGAPRGKRANMDDFEGWVISFDGFQTEG